MDNEIPNPEYDCDFQDSEMAELGSSVERCPECAEDFVAPVQWLEVRQGVWWVSLRCGNCEWVGEDIFPQDDCERFEEALHVHMKQLEDDYERTLNNNLADEADRFEAALAADAIQAADFELPPGRRVSP